MDFSQQHRNTVRQPRVLPQSQRFDRAGTSTPRANAYEPISFVRYYTDALGRLRGSGTQRMALCPFHPDRNPSLSLQVETGCYHCFACGAQGDALRFHMQLHGVSYAEAVRFMEAFR